MGDVPAAMGDDVPVAKDEGGAALHAASTNVTESTNATKSGTHTKFGSKENIWDTAQWLAQSENQTAANVTALSENITSSKELKLKQESEKKKTASKKKQKGSSMKDQPTDSVALDGGDIWAGSRLSEDEMRELVIDVAMSTRVRGAVTSQWFPKRQWLWGQWSGTIVKAVLPREVLTSAAVATMAVIALRLVPDITAQLRGVQRV